MTSVVTGASGHIGINLVRALLARGVEVRAVVHHTSEPLAGLDVQRITADVLDPASLSVAFRGAEIVYHLAGVISLVGDPTGRVRAVNVDGASNAAAAALDADVRRFVHCSSIHAFDLRRGGGAIDETAPRVPAGSKRHPAYDLSKADGERRVRAWADRGLAAVIAHPTSVIGPHDHEPSRMGRVFLALAAGALPALVAGAFDFVDVRDVAEGLIAAADRGAIGESYLLGGHRLEVAELARVAGRHTGVRPPRFTSPMWLARAGAPFATRWAAWRGSDPLYSPESLAALRMTALVDTTKAGRDLGFRPRPIDDTVRDVYRWFAANGALSPANGARP